MNLLKENSDTNIKMIIIDLLKKYKKINKKLIFSNLADFLKIFENQNSSIKICLNSLILDLIDNKY